LSDYNDCIKKGLLKKTVASRGKARKSLDAASKWLVEAEKNLAAGTLRSSLISAYLAVFHAARSVLFFDGYREKSHTCVARYLEEKCVRRGLLELKWVDMLDHFREIRHADQYSFSFFTTSEEAEDTIAKSSAFVERMKKLIEEKTEK